MSCPPNSTRHWKSHVYTKSDVGVWLWVAGVVCVRAFMLWCAGVVSCLDSSRHFNAPRWRRNHVIGLSDQQPPCAVPLRSSTDLSFRRRCSHNRNRDYGACADRHHFRSRATRTRSRTTRELTSRIVTPHAPYLSCLKNCSRKFRSHSSLIRFANLPRHYTIYK